MCGSKRIFIVALFCSLFSSFSANAFESSVQFKSWAPNVMGGFPVAGRALFSDTHEVSVMIDAITRAYGGFYDYRYLKGKWGNLSPHAALGVGLYSLAGPVISVSFGNNFQFGGFAIRIDNYFYFSLFKGSFALVEPILLHLGVSWKF